MAFDRCPCVHPDNQRKSTLVVNSHVFHRLSPEPRRDSASSVARRPCRYSRRICGFTLRLASVQRAFLWVAGAALTLLKGSAVCVPIWKALIGFVRIPTWAVLRGHRIYVGFREPGPGSRFSGRRDLRTEFRALCLRIHGKVYELQSIFWIAEPD